VFDFWDSKRNRRTRTSHTESPNVAVLFGRREVRIKLGADYSAVDEKNRALSAGCSQTRSQGDYDRVVIDAVEGSWRAQPDQDTTIVLSLPDPSHFTWKVTHQGQSRELQGRLTYGNGLLTLAQDQGAPMVGNVTWTDASHFTFKVPGAGPDDPGLTFSKAP